MDATDFISLYAAVIATIVAFFQIWQHVTKKPKIKIFTHFEYIQAREDDGYSSAREARYELKVTAINRGSDRTTLLNARIEKRGVPIWNIFKPRSSKLLKPLIFVGARSEIRESPWFPARLESGEVFEFMQFIHESDFGDWNSNYNFLVITAAHSDVPSFKRLPRLSVSK